MFRISTSVAPLEVCCVGTNSETSSAEMVIAASNCPVWLMTSMSPMRKSMPDALMSVTDSKAIRKSQTGLPLICETVVAALSLSSVDVVTRMTIVPFSEPSLRMSASTSKKCRVS